MRCRTGLKSAALGLLGRVRACDGALCAGRGGPEDHGAARARRRASAQRRRRQQMSAGAASHGGPRRPAVRQQDRPDADRSRSCCSQGERITEVGPEAQVKIPAGAKVIDLSQATVLPGLIDAHTHMFNPPKPGHVAGDLDAHRHAEPAGRPAGRLHHGARHELPRQRLWRCRHPQRHQRGPHRRPALPGVGPRHRVGRAAGHRAGEPADQHRGALGRRSERGGARAHRARRRLDQAVSRPAPIPSPRPARRNTC